MKRLMQTFALVMCCVIMLAPAGVGAAGTQYTSGWARGKIEYYSNPRWVTNPATPGPEVAFYTNYGPNDLYLGPNNCLGANIAVMLPQEIGAWSPVAYFGSPTMFCVSSAAPHSNAEFAGIIDWD